MMMFYYVIQKTEIRYEFSQIILPQSFSTSLSSKYLVVFICHRNEKHQQNYVSNRRKVGARHWEMKRTDNAPSMQRFLR